MSKFCLFLLLSTILTTYAKESYAQNARVSLELNNVPLSKVISEIKRQTEFEFAYDSGLEAITFEKVSVRATDENIEQILNSVLAHTGVNYRIIDKIILLSKNPAIVETASRQGIMVKGTIIDETGEPIPGVNVLVKGTLTGTVTDIGGRYSINTHNAATTLVFSFIGYLTQEIVTGDRREINLTMTEDTQQLEEVVVVGYGTVRKRDLTGSVSSISSNDLKKVPVTSFDQAIQGRASGVQVTQASSAPGGRVMIRVRGGNSLSSSNEPLYVVDGYPISAGSSTGGNGAGQNPLASLNTSDISSIEILKDASATAIYGARGANGVVLITTKRGQTGKTQVTLDGYYGVQKIANKLDMMNAREFAELVNEARAYDNLAPVFPNNNNPHNFPDVSSLGEGVNYQDEVFRSAPVQNYNLGISGGNEAVRYSIGGSYFDQTGILRGSDFQRASFRANIDAKLTKTLSVAVNFSASHVWGNNGKSEGDGGGNAGVINSAILMPATVPIKQADGTYTKQNPTPGGSTIHNPVPIVLFATDKQEIDRILGTAEANWEIIKNLSLKITFGTDMSSANREIYWPVETVNGFNTSGHASQANRKMASYLNENILSYKNTFGHHSFNVTAGYTWQTFHDRNFDGSSTGYPTDLFGPNNMDAGTVYRKPNSDKNQSQLASYLGRINYIYMDRYLFTLTGRADGSSKFGTNNKWGFFPSFAAAWRISEESFMQPVSVISNLKLRASYGRTGNQSIANYKSLAQLATMNYAFGGKLNSGVGPNNIENPDLKWETTATTDVGIDFGLFKNRLNVVVDYYYKKTTDLLWDITIPKTSGFATKFRNIGSLENKGIEIGLGGDILVGEFTWNSQLNWSRNRNKVLEIPGFTPSIQGTLSAHAKVNGSWLEPGLPVGVWNLLQYDGVFQDQAQLNAGPTSSGARLGDARFVDKSGNGSINYTDDRMIVGDPNPDFTFGWSNNFSYKGFDLSIYIQGSYGNDIINVQRAENAISGPWGNQRREILDRWTPTNTTADVPRARVTIDPLLIQSSWLIEDGSYLRVKTMTLGYTFNNIRNISSLRLYVTGQNLLTWTNYSGFDPEVNSQGNSNLQLGVDYNAYPSARSVMFGVNVAF